MDTARLAAIRAREQAASPGPWELSDWTEDDGPNATTLTAYRPPATDLEARLVSQVSPGRWPIAIAELGEGVSPADAAFLLHARADVPDLLAEVERLRAGLTQLRQAHSQGDIFCCPAVALSPGPCQCGADAHNAWVDALLHGGHE